MHSRRTLLIAWCLALAVSVAACGSGSSRSGSRADTNHIQKKYLHSIYADCSQYRALIADLHSVQGLINVGVNVGDYRTALLPASTVLASVGLSCFGMPSTTAAAAGAFNAYNDALQVWSDCVQNLAQSDCTKGTAGSRVQHDWEQAGNLLQKAADGMEHLRFCASLSAFVSGSCKKF
jgi:hypothetical protein